MKQGNVAAVLNRQMPERIVYAPNYWQWFTYHRNHGSLPEEVHDCESQLAMIQYLGLDIFSRNIYSDEETDWWGGLSETVWSPSVRCEEHESRDGQDRVFERIYRTRAGTLSERLRYVFRGSTLVQEKFLVEDYETQLDILEEILKARSWRFSPESYRKWRAQVGPDGCVVAGELHSPLKMLHRLLNAENATLLLEDYPDRAAVLLKIHEDAMLDLTRQIAEAGVPALMSMDNLDTAFHPPNYVERFCASFYEKAAELCHQHDSRLFIHACGHQRHNLKLIADLGVDGLEGVAFPPLGDVELDEAFELSGDRLIITGGISAIEFERLATREEIFEYVRDLFERIRPFAHRFILSASCNTPYNASWQKILYFRDAWQEYAHF